VLPDDLSVGRGDLTASLKLRRTAVGERFAADIERLYEPEDRPVAMASGAGGLR
jgi:hypothetical protein